MSEWLRSWTRNPMGFARRGSNPLGVAFSLFVFSTVVVEYRTKFAWEIVGLLSSAVRAFGC